MMLTVLHCCWFQILYGLDLSMSRSQFSKVEQLAEFLGIALDIKHGEPEPATTWRPTRSSSPQKVPENVRPEVPEKSRKKVSEKAKDVEAELAQALTADLTNIIPKVLAKAAAKIPRRIAAKISSQVEVPNITTSSKKVHNITSPNKVPNITTSSTKVPSIVSSPNKVPNPMLPGSLPICCWHCNESFGNLDDLQTHLKTHKGELPKSSKKHKCQKCKKVSLSSSYFFHLQFVIKMKSYQI